MSDVETTVSIRGLPDWLIRDYLADMGATPDGGAKGGADASPAVMRADRWSVTWTSQRVPIAGSASLTLTQYDLTFSGESDAVAEATRVFLAKAQRGGG
ncbi:MAG: hypothetical protein O3B31_03560 [Chloroflexi bacterium]|nr:hypothetical protein [Chloroflexota bacterium]MDA1002416.1 hypothetical protein [Chloroflexota bacterium]